MCTDAMGALGGAAFGGKNKAPVSGLIPMLMARKKKDAGAAPNPGKGALAAAAPTAGTLLK